MTLHSSGLVSTRSSAKTAAATLADGFHAVSAIIAAMDAATGGEDTDHGLLISLGPAIAGRRDRGASIMFASTEADNATVSAKIRLVYGGPNFNPLNPSADELAEVRLLGTATLTIGSGTGVGSSLVLPSTYRVADTISWSGTAYATLLESLHNTLSIDSLKRSPADNTVAVLNIPDCDNAAAILVEFVNANASKASVAVARVWT